ncbi:MAG: LPS assembly lipoprotein LptE [Gemmataceae bacterium]|nr:LPS assembly lipoprotein LptE [Gemmataceae bacterium]MCI0742250.1 LPS assembly lipoprotein LptE [Gemmataceae bacterium]
MTHALLRVFFLALTPALLAGCSSDGHLCILGYTTRPNYDPSIHTVYVPIFQNVTFARGLEFDLTRAVIREIESKSTIKVVSNCENADSELIGKIFSTNKSLITLNQLGEVREAEGLMGVEIVWRDLRAGQSGQLLSGNGKKVGHPEGAPPPPIVVQPNASFVPELGGSLTSAQKQLVDRTAIQIVSMMEQPW